MEEDVTIDHSNSTASASLSSVSTQNTLAANFNASKTSIGRFMSTGSIMNGAGSGIAGLTHLEAIYGMLINSGLTFLTGMFAIVFGKVIIPSLYPFYKALARKLGYEPLDLPQIIINSNNVFHRCIRTGAVFFTNLFYIPAAIIGYLYMSGHPIPGSIDNAGIAAGTIISSIVGGVIFGIILTLLQLYYDITESKKQKDSQTKVDVENPSVKLILEGWTKYLKTSVVVCNQLGVLVACTVIAAVPGAASISSFLIPVCSAIGGVVGGTVSPAAIIIIGAADKYLAQYSWYQKSFAAMADADKTNNPPSNRIKTFLQIFLCIGIIAGAIVGSVFPGLGTLLGMGFGGAIFGLVGAVIGYVSEPIINYFLDPKINALRSANPWSNRFRSLALLGAIVGSAIGFLFGGIGIPVGAAVGSLAIGLGFMFVEPIVLRCIIRIRGKHILEDKNYLQESSGNPWTSRLPMGATIGAFAGGILFAIIGFAVGGPPALAITVPIGIICGSIGGGIIGASLTQNVRNKVTWLFSYTSDKSIVTNEKTNHEQQPKTALAPSSNVQIIKALLTKTESQATISNNEKQPETTAPLPSSTQTTEPLTKTESQASLTSTEVAGSPSDTESDTLGASNSPNLNPTTPSNSAPPSPRP